MKANKKGGATRPKAGTTASINIYIHIYIKEERDAVGQRKIHKEKIGVQPDLNLRRKRLAARLSQMVTAKPLGQLKKKLASWQAL